jgi:hypothetical protein
MGFSGAALILAGVAKRPWGVAQAALLAAKEMFTAHGHPSILYGLLVGEGFDVLGYDL